MSIMMMMMMMICSSEGRERGWTEGNWTSACVGLQFVEGLIVARGMLCWCAFVKFPVQLKT